MPRYVIERTFPDGIANSLSEMNNVKTLTLTAAVLSSVVFTMPTSSQAVPQAVPVKIDAASSVSPVQIHYRGYCGYGRCYAPDHRYDYYREHYRPYYGYYRPSYGYYRPYYVYHRPDCSYYPVTLIYPGSVIVIDVEDVCGKGVARPGQNGGDR